MKAFIVVLRTNNDLNSLKILVPQADNLVLEILDDKISTRVGDEPEKNSYIVISEIVIEDEVVAKALKVTSEQKNLQVHYSYIKHLIARARNSLG